MKCKRGISTTIHRPFQVAHKSRSRGFTKAGRNSTKGKAGISTNAVTKTWILLREYFRPSKNQGLVHYGTYPCQSLFLELHCLRHEQECNSGVFLGSLPIFRWK